MKHALLCFLLSASPAAARSVPSFSLRPVTVPEIGFKAALNDGRVIASWLRYKRDDFISYQVVKSTEPDPMYPAVPAICSSRDVGGVDCQDGGLSPGIWYYRLIIVTRYGERWASPAVTVAIAPEQIHRSVPTAADFEP